MRFQSQPAHHFPPFLCRKRTTHSEVFAKNVWAPGVGYTHRYNRSCHQKLTDWRWKGASGANPFLLFYLERTGRQEDSICIPLLLYPEISHIRSIWHGLLFPPVGPFSRRYKLGPYMLFTYRDMKGSLNKILALYNPSLNNDQQSQLISLAFI
jgi:hypothetical protein